jgi:hypothetical protein
LPRQARDKQRERALKNKTLLLFEQAVAAAAAATDRYETRLSFERLIYKTIILPRQTRDKDKESTGKKKRMRFSQAPTYEDGRYVSVRQRRLF